VHAAADSCLKYKHTSKAKIILKTWSLTCQISQQFERKAGQKKKKTLNLENFTHRPFRKYPVKEQSGVLFSTVLPDWLWCPPNLLSNQNKELYAWEKSSMRLTTDLHLALKLIMCRTLYFHSPVSPWCGA
jgi:hypothetical protein